MLPKKTSLAIVTFAVLVLLLNFTKLARLVAPSAVDSHPRLSDANASASTRTPRRPGSARPHGATANLIDDHENLKAFYQALWRTESRLPGAVTRILHYGDSPVTADSITADVRSLLQEHFGDAG